jgi:hypothetical protein
MDKKNPVQTGDQEPIARVQPKKPYKKPAFQFERVFETQALRCGKVGSSAGPCHTNPKSS